MSFKTVEVEEHIDYVKGLKQVCVDSYMKDDRECTDMPPFIDIRRDGEVVGLISCHDVNRDEALQAVHMAVPGWSADYVTLFLDTVQATERFEEVFGRLPDPGELNDLIRHPKAQERGLATEAIAIVEMDREGHRRFTTLPYVIDLKTGEINWQDDNKILMDSEEDEAAVKGYLPDVLKEAFDAPVITERLTNIDPRDFGLDPESPEVRIHMDLAVVRLLTGAGYLCAFACPTPLHKELLHHSIKSMPGLSYINEDNEVVHSEQELSAMEMMGLAALRMKLESERYERRKEQEDERFRRQAERGAELLKDLENS